MLSCWGRKDNGPGRCRALVLRRPRTTRWPRRRPRRFRQRVDASTSESAAASSSHHRAVAWPAGAPLIVLGPVPLARDGASSANSGWAASRARRLMPSSEASPVSLPAAGDAVPIRERRTPRAGSPAAERHRAAEHLAAPAPAALGTRAGAAVVAARSTNAPGQGGSSRARRAGARSAPPPPRDAARERRCGGPERRRKGAGRASPQTGPARAGARAAAAAPLGRTSDARLARACRARRVRVARAAPVGGHEPLRLAVAVVARRGGGPSGGSQAHAARGSVPPAPTFYAVEAARSSECASRSASTTSKTSPTS